MKLTHWDLCYNIMLLITLVMAACLVTIGIFEIFNFAKCGC